MKILTVVFFLLLVIIEGCHTATSKTQPALPVADTAKFYPLRSFFKDQLQYIDLRNYNMYKITVRDGKKDSSSLNKDQFRQLADIFLQRDISAPEIKILYKESVFHDLGTGSITLNYTPLDNKAVVQNIDVLLDDQTNLVKRIFIRSFYTKGDSTISEQCNWKADRSFQVNRSITAKNGNTTTELNYINWNDKP